MKYLFGFLSICIISPFLVAQQIKIGDWAMHLNYTNVTTAINVDKTIYVGTKMGLFLYDNSDHSVTPFSKLDGLSGLNISALAYSNQNKLLVIGYLDGNIDIMSGGTVINIPYIMFANIIGSKTINHIFIDRDYAYLSCDFGLVVLDLSKMEIKETCYLSNDGTNTEVFSSYVFDEDVYTAADAFLANKIFVGTSKGLFYADKNHNLLNYEVWGQDSRVSLSTSNAYIHSLSNTPVPIVVGFDKNENGGKNLMIYAEMDYTKTAHPWMGLERYNLFHLNTLAFENPYSTSLNVFNVNPGVPGDIVGVNHNQNINHSLIITNDNNTEKVIVLNELMENILSVNSKNIKGSELDFSLLFGVFSDDYYDSKKLFFGDAKYGLISAKKNSFSIDFDELIAPNGPAGINVGSIIGDENSIVLTHGAKTSQWNNLYNQQEISFFNNALWSQSSQLINLGIYDAIPVCRGTGETLFVGTWNSGVLEFNGESLINHYTENNTSGVLESIMETDGVTRIGGLDFDASGALWVSNSQTNRPLVRFHNKTWNSFSVPDLSNNIMSGKIMCASNNQKWIQLRDDGVVIARELKGGFESRKIGTENGLPSNTVHCFEEDKNGEIWVGTSQGLSIFYFPSEIFNNPYYSAEYILIETEDGYVEKLFENTEILDIKVDDANRKWIGTKMNGVFLISDDGTSQIYNFTKENSPLLSNAVYDIDIIKSSGEVFFLTSSGLCSYRGDATASRNNFNNVSVFPNPVKPDYVGEIAISGLSDETNIKITTISGDLVFETTSNGGTATWNGENFDGVRVSTGVYLFLCTSSDFKTSVVKKILIYN